MHGESRVGHEQLAWFWSGNRAVRRGDWKLVWDKLNPDKHWELYNVAEDRCELNNLAAEHPDRVRQMSDDWFAWADEMKVKVKR